MKQKYWNKINQIDPKKRGIIYIILAIILLNFPDFKWGYYYESTGISILSKVFFLVFLFFLVVEGIKLLLDQIIADRVKKAEEKTEFIHEGKLYNIKKAKLILKIEHLHYYDQEIKPSEQDLYTILYQSTKGIYFLYVMDENCNANIKTLSEYQAKDLLLNHNIEKYKQVFGEIEEA